MNNRWNRWSENQSINRWQSMPINLLISIIDEQSMLRFFVIIDFIDYQFLSIINANRSVNWHQLSSIGFHFFSQDFQKHGLFMHFNDKLRWNFISFTMVIDTSWRTWAYNFITIAILNWPSNWWIMMKLGSKKIKGQCFKIEYHPMQCWCHIKKIKNHPKTLTLVMICLSNCILNCNIKMAVKTPWKRSSPKGSGS